MSSQPIQTPYFTISKSKVMEKYEVVKNMSDHVSYSSKTNQTVTKILEEQSDCFFSVHLINELKHLKDLSRAIFLAQGWNKDLIQDLVSKGINWFVVDNEADLDTLTNFLETYDGKINLLLRWKLKENTIKTEKYYVFGMRTDAIEKHIPLLRKNSKINKLGIHFHRKTQNLAEWNLVFEMENSFDEEFWKNIDLVNAGGGLPSEYANTNIEVFNSIAKKLADLKQFLNEKDIKLMLEPGRFIASYPGRLHTTIIGIHGDTIIVDASVYNGDLDAIVVPVKLLVEGELPKGEGKQYVVKGVTPCSMDIFRYRVYLQEKKVGDELVFINAGAYNFNSDFCDLEPMKTIVVD